MKALARLALSVTVATAVPTSASAQSSLLVSFKADAGFPNSRLILGSDGNLYGVTESDGVYGLGSVFAMAPDGSAFRTLHSFTNAEGANPSTELFEASDGFIYGTTMVGPAYQAGGMLFRFDPQSYVPGSEIGIQIVHVFKADDPQDGGYPNGGLVEIGGVLFGTTLGGGAANGGTVYRLDVSTNPATYIQLHSFDVNPESQLGAQPVGALTIAGGELYGVTTFGGQSDWGTVFKVDPLGSDFEIVNDFGVSGGLNPQSGLLLDNGYLYGTTPQPCSGGNGCGTIFRINVVTGEFEFVHSFNGDAISVPVGPLVRGGDGAFYGLAAVGNAVFRLDVTTTPLATVTVMASLDPATTGARLFNGLVAVGTALYGTAAAGGPHGAGTVFQLLAGAPNAASLMHAFGPIEPHGMAAGLVSAGGQLYGTTSYGGAGNSGTVIRVDQTTGAVSVLHEFVPFDVFGAPNPVDGGYPGALLRASNGSFYGMTYLGPQNNPGMVFRVDDNGQYQVLQSFSRTAPSPAYPNTSFAPQGLVEFNGMLYGMTEGGGDY